ncbi:hypothetical protein [Pantoea sp. App145]|uniref:hypothetical protein n=1 Tax=Pantoea sp. App145 TaxID=3071567 RepID=UPI003A7FDB1B
MSEEDDFSGLSYGKRYKPDDGCDWTEVIIWEMRKQARIRARINAVRPVPVRVIEVNGNAERKTVKSKRAKAGRKPASVAGRNSDTAAGSTGRSRAA